MTVRRSTGKIQVGRAIWYTKPGIAELRPAPLATPKPSEARVRTLFSGISRGTERLILAGAVAPSEWDRMRAPLQEGDFAFPVKYGYCATGIVEAGPKELLGKTVFCLHPHQDVFIAPAAMLAVVPDGVPARRATLAANAETALNALWDAGAGPADRIVVVGAGVVGLMVAAIAARLPGAEVTVVDVDPGRRAIVESFGARFEAAGSGQQQARPALAVAAQSPVAAHPNPLPTAEVPWGEGTYDADIVFHTSASEAGLNAAIGLAGMEGTVVEMSWYGDKAVTVDLGGAFHSRRLKLISSQVGQVSPSRRPRWSYARRLASALALLDNPALDALVADEIAFEDAARELPRILAPAARGLAPVIRYTVA